MEHEVFIQRCLDLAIAGRGKVSPNPMVGCVITDAQGHILSEGFHEYYGGPHAEVNAFSHLQGALPQGARLYVSLEPCNHHGKTPPCTELILNSGIREIYIADTDPNPLVSGRGIARLKAAGLKVVCGILSEKAAELNRTFYGQHIHQRPYYALKWAQTANGKIGNDLYSHSGEQRITGEIAQTFSHRLRTEFDAILVGVNTIITDNPRLNARLWPGKNPVIIVLDPNNRIPKEAAIFSNGSKVIVLNSHKNEHTPLVQYIQIDFNQWPDEMNRVLLQSSIQSVLVEGGAKTLQTFIEHGIWDECYIFESSEVRNWNIHAPAISGNIQSRYPIGDDLLTLLKPES